jgi:hypothetical protein
MVYWYRLCLWRPNPAKVYIGLLSNLSHLKFNQQNSPLDYGLNEENCQSGKKIWTHCFLLSSSQGDQMSLRKNRP